MRALDPPADEILVVDNTHGDPQTKEISLRFGARYVVEPAVGLSRARNRGLVESTCDIAAYIDDDAVPRPHWAASLLTAFEDPKVGVVAGRTITPVSGERLPETPIHVTNKDLHWFEIATFGGLGLGNNMALRRSACAGWTVFDVRLGRGAPIEIAEENYAFASLLSRGYTGVYLPSAVVDHPPLHHDTTLHEARNSFAYWLLLFFAFPARRRDLVAFLSRRLRHEKLGWQRDADDPGEIISSSWWVKLKAAWSGLLLFLRSKD